MKLSILYHIRFCSFGGGARESRSAQFENENNCDFPEKEWECAVVPHPSMVRWWQVNFLWEPKSEIELKVFDKHQLQTRADCLLLHFIGPLSRLVLNISGFDQARLHQGHKPDQLSRRDRLLTTDGNLRLWQSEGARFMSGVWTCSSNGQLCLWRTSYCDSLWTSSTSTDMFRWTGLDVN